MNNSVKNHPFHLIPALLLLTLAGCASTTTPHYEQRIGEAVRTAVAQQTINPDASKNTDPVAGLDGKSAKQTINNYEKSFVTPEKTTLSGGVGGN